jgi:phenylacetate-coenzyme A ligase PaaK-like adenylate-forming protein
MKMFRFFARVDELGITPEQIRSVDDLVKLPFTYKLDLRDNYPYGMFACTMEEGGAYPRLLRHHRKANRRRL